MSLFEKLLSSTELAAKTLNCFTTRAVRDLVLIQPVDEIHIMEELGNFATTSNIVSYVD